MSSSPVRLVLLAGLALFSLGSACAPSRVTCSLDADCCGDNVCTPAPWESPETSLCLPAPPVCYEEGMRCAGAPGKEFVPYANCCNPDLECTEDVGLGYGRFCSSTVSQMQKAVALLKSIETGDQASLAFVNATNYVQHNLGAPDGIEGLEGIFASGPPGTFSQETIRVFEDGDFVFLHSSYDLGGPQIGFDVFRFESGLIVEHWDNLQPTAAEPNPSGRTMIDGPTEATSLDMTEANKAVAADFVTEIFINGGDNITSYFSPTLAQHNPQAADGLDGFFALSKTFTEEGTVMVYETLHKVLGMGDFVLTISEGLFGKDGGVPTAFYDLFRIEGGMLVEHWDVIQEIPPREEWANENGKFGF